MTAHKRNYFAFQWHATFLALTLALTDINTVLSSLLVKTGGGSVQIGLLTAIMVGTPILGQLLFASYLHLRPSKKGFLLLGVNFRIIALAIVSVVLIRAETMSANIMITLLFILMFIFAFSGTFAGISYTDILGKSLLPDQRNRFFVNRQVITSLALLASTPVARWIFIHIGYPNNYAWLFGSASGLLLLASLGFWAIDEPKVEVSSDTHSFTSVLRSIPRYMRNDPQLLRYIILTNLTGFGLTLMPFYVLYASTRYELTGEQIGTYLLVQIMGMVVSNILWAKLIKKSGFRGIARACIICGTLLPILALVLVGMPLPVFLVVFFLMGVALSARRIAFDGLLIEITTDTNRALYGGIVGATNLTTAIFPLIAGGLIYTLGYTPVFLGVSAIIASAWTVTHSSDL